MALNQEAPPGAWSLTYETQDKIREALGFITTEYVSNSWASCAFIYGPHGWCSPDGTILYVDNVGKWPSVQDVFNDFVILAKAFPYVALTATLMNGEECEEGILPVITFVVENGSVRLTDEHESFHYATKGTPDRSIDHAISQLGFFGREQGLPDEWIIEYGQKITPIIEPIMAELRVKLANLSDEHTKASTVNLEPLPPVTFGQPRDPKTGRFIKR